MATVTAVLWTYRKNKKGLSPIYVRVSDGDRTRYKSVRVYVKPAHWNERAGRVTARHPDASAVNKLIGEVVRAAEAEVFRRSAEGEAADAASVVDSLKAARRGGRSDFFAFADELVEGYRDRGQIWTYDRYRSVFKKLRVYTGEPFPFERLTPALLRRYETYLAAPEPYGNSVNTIATNMNAIRTVVRRAVAEGLMPYDGDPFNVHKIRHERTERVRLTFAEVQRLGALELEPFSVPGVSRNAFLLQFYLGGARFSDIAFLRWRSVRDGSVAYMTSKSKKAVLVPIVSQAAAILDLYGSARPGPDRLVLPLLEGYDLSTSEGRKKAVRSRTTRTNKALKSLARSADIGKNLSTHVARHSFADHCRTSGMSLYDISRALRRSSIKQTERYLAGLDTGGLGDKMQALFDT